MSEEIHFLSLVELSKRIHRGELTSEHVVAALLERIEKVDGHFRSFVRLLSESAMREARRADQEFAAGMDRGTLHGVPVGVKDLVHMKGVPTTAGFPALGEHDQDYDATVVKRLRMAGAVIIGKLQMTEGAGMEHHPSVARPQNPWNENHWTGVSSSGSAVAVTAGLCYAALGSDTGGSIRMPSAACGLTGLKPTWGRVSRYGIFPLAHSFDCVGPLARSAVDNWAVFEAIAGPDPNDFTASSEPFPGLPAHLPRRLDGVTIGIDWAHAGTDIAEDVLKGLKSAVAMFEDLGASIREVSFPPSDALFTDMVPIIFSEMALSHGEELGTKVSLYSEKFAEAVKSAGSMTSVAIASASERRAQYTGRMRALLSQVELLLVPGLPSAAPTWEEIDEIVKDPKAISYQIVRFTFPFSLTGNPTLTLPSGFTSKGLPVSIQLVAPHGKEDALLRAGICFQSVTEFHTMRPPIE